MATNRDLLKEAIADAKAIKETAIANAKLALEESFTPFFKEKFSAKLAEMENEEEMTMNEEEATEEISLDELLAELEDENLSEAAKDDKDDKDEKPEGEDEKGEEEEEEEIDIENMSSEDLKSFIESVIEDMVSAGELEAGHEGMEDEPGAEDEPGVEGEEEIDLDAEVPEEGEEEEINIDELLAELEENSYTSKATDPSPKSKNAVFAEENKISEAAELSSGLSDPQMAALVAALGAGLVAKLVSLAKKDKESAKKTVEKAISGETEKQVAEITKTLDEVKLLNAKLLYTNKIFRNKSLTESQKVKVLTAFDKATSKKEAELVYETLLESLKISTNKTQIKESLGSASKVLGGNTSKPIIENDVFARMQELAFGKKKK